MLWHFISTSADLKYNILLKWFLAEVLQIGDQIMVFTETLILEDLGSTTALYQTSQISYLL